MERSKNYTTLNNIDYKKLTFACVLILTAIIAYVNLGYVMFKNIGEQDKVYFKMMSDYSVLEEASDKYIEKIERKKRIAEGPIDITSDAYLGTQGLDKYADKEIPEGGSELVDPSMIDYRASDRVYMTDGIVTVYGNGVGELVTVISLLEGEKIKTYDCSEYTNDYDGSSDIQYVISKIYSPYSKNTLKELRELFTDECYMYIEKTIKPKSGTDNAVVSTRFVRFGATDKESGVVDTAVVGFTVLSEDKEYSMVLMLQLDENLHINNINIV